MTISSQGRDGKKWLLFCNKPWANSTRKNECSIWLCLGPAVGCTAAGCFSVSHWEGNTEEPVLGKGRANKLLLRPRASSGESKPKAAHTMFLRQGLESHTLGNHATLTDTDTWIYRFRIKCREHGIPACSNKTKDERWGGEGVWLN